MIPDMKAALAKAPSATPAPRLKGIHHSAFRCRDAEETRQFYEDILGLDLKATLVFDEEPGTGRHMPYMHLFFEMGDGNYIAFFDVPEGAHEGKFKMKWGFDMHFAFEANSMDEMMAFKKRLDDCGIPCFGPIDHHFVHSIYFYDPNGVNVEITCRDAQHDAIMLAEAGNAKQVMADWSARTAAAKAANKASVKVA